MTEYDGVLYFLASDGTSGFELWSYTSSGGAQLVEDINSSGSSSPKHLIVYDNELYFQASDGNTDPGKGVELWKYNGVDASRVTDINPDTGSGLLAVEMIVAHGALYFVGNDGSNGNELWRYDGTNAEMAVDLDAGVGNGLANPTYFAVYGSDLYFGGSDGSSGYELWKYDGSEAVLVKDINPSGSSNPMHFAVWGEGLYFQADDGTSGAELWVLK
jgi:ELWxxDGT repeat protein